MASANAVARYLLKEPLWGDVQLQKLVYYSQAWALTWTGRPLFEESIEAWANGPVVPSVYAMRKRGDIDFEPDELNDSERAVVDAVFAFYGQMNGSRLSDMTHSEAPWKDAWNDGVGRNSVIDRASIRREYTEQALLEPHKVPRRPGSAPVAAPTERVLEIADRQRVRWRKALDLLAKR
jgi:uncharacterized phage-associated protein